MHMITFTMILILIIAAHVISIRSLNHELMKYMLIRPYTGRQEDHSKVTKLSSADATDDGQELYAKRHDLEQYPSLVFDYANTIQNDFILFDNTISMQYKRNRITQNQKVSRRDKPILGQPAFPAVASCGTCIARSKQVYWGDNYYPPGATNITCQMEKSACIGKYRCQPQYRKIFVLKRRCDEDDERDGYTLPEDLKNYVFVAKKIVSDCQCVHPGR